MILLEYDTGMIPVFSGKKKVTYLSKYRNHTGFDMKRKIRRIPYYTSEQSANKITQIVLIPQDDAQLYQIVRRG